MQKQNDNILCGVHIINNVIWWEFNEKHNSDERFEKDEQKIIDDELEEKRRQTISEELEKERKQKIIDDELEKERKQTIINWLRELEQEGDEELKKNGKK